MVALFITFYITALISAENLGLPVVDASDRGIIDNILNIVFMLAGALATIFIIIGALRYVLSVGSPEGIEQAKNTIIYAIIGLVVTVLAYGIVNFVISAL